MVSWTKWLFFSPAKLARLKEATEEGTTARAIPTKMLSSAKSSLGARYPLSLADTLRTRGSGGGCLAGCCADQRVLLRAQSGSQPPETRVTPLSPLPMRCVELCSACVAYESTACNPFPTSGTLQPQLTAVFTSFQPRSLLAQEELGIIDEQLRSDGWCASPPPSCQAAHAYA